MIRDSIKEQLVYSFFTRHGTLETKRRIVKITRSESTPGNFWLHFDDTPKKSVSEAYLKYKYGNAWKRILVNKTGGNRTSFAELKRVELNKTCIKEYGTAHGLDVVVTLTKDTTTANVIGTDGMRLPLHVPTAVHIANAMEKQLSDDMWNKTVEHLSNLMFPEEYTDEDK